MGHSQPQWFDDLAAEDRDMIQCAIDRAYQFHPSIKIDTLDVSDLAEIFESMHRLLDRIAAGRAMIAYMMADLYPSDVHATH